MDNGASPDFDKLIQNVMSHPEMLKSAFEIAGKLSENGALGSLFAGLNNTSSSENNAFTPPNGDAAEEKAGEEAASVSAASPIPAKGAGKKDMTRHRKLLEALELYVSDDKRDKLELVIRLLDLWELAGNLGL